MRRLGLNRSTSLSSHRFLAGFALAATLLAGRGLLAQDTPPLPPPEGPPAPSAGEGATAATESTAPKAAAAVPTPRSLAGFEMPQVTPGPTITLAEALDAVERRSLTLEAARLEIAKAEAQLKQSWALVLPGAQASMELMHRDHEDAVNFGGQSMVLMAQDDLSGSIGVGMSLINAQNWATIGVAKQGVKVAELSIENARQRLLHGVAQAYYFCLTLESMIGMYEEQIASAAHHLDVARARYDAGVGLRIDVIRAETDLEMAKQELITSHLSYENVRDTLAKLTQTQGLPIPVDTAPLVAPSQTPEQLVETAEDQRSDLEVNRALIELADRQLNASWMQFLPTLDASWGLQYQFTEPSALGSQDRSRWALVFTLSVPIYNHFRYGDLDYKRAVLRQAQIQAEDGTQEVSLDVRSKHRDYLTSLSTAQVAERQAELAAEALTLMEASYEAGTGTSLDVTDARRTKIQTDANVIAQRLKAQIALLNLLQSIGTDMLELGGPVAKP